ncbi:DUF3021 family protein [Streptococcus devriesei]|uniref:DUF3021 family protein n=1 Tax=Streptococcus devriesei TaxID=231233 RepID=UPI000686BD5B
MFSICSLCILYFKQNPDFTWQTFCGGIISTAIAGAWNIYDINSWSLRKRSLIHFLLMAIIVLPTVLVSGWFPIRGMGDILILLAVFACFGLVFWTIGYFAFRNK